MDVERRFTLFAKWKKQVVTRSEILGGERVFPNSSSRCDDYPYLKTHDIEFARHFVAAYPRVGRACS